MFMTLPELPLLLDDEHRDDDVVMYIVNIGKFVPNHLPTVVKNLVQERQNWVDEVIAGLKSEKYSPERFCVHANRILNDFYSYVCALYETNHTELGEQVLVVMDSSASRIQTMAQVAGLNYTWGISGHRYTLHVWPESSQNQPQGNG